MQLTELPSLYEGSWLSLFSPQKHDDVRLCRPLWQTGGLTRHESVQGKNMSVLITLLVAGLVVVYLRSNSKARANWLQNLSLPGHWVSQRDGSHLSLAGSFDSGEFVRQGETSNDSGDWRYQGERLTLNGTHQHSFIVQMFQPGVISLTAEDGKAELFHKQSDNVVSLAKR
jgi:hypothetical protein